MCVCVFIHADIKAEEPVLQVAGKIVSPIKKRVDGVK